MNNKRGSMMIEMIVALGIVVSTIIPLGYSFVQEQHRCRTLYWKAVAMEVVDGETEVLAAGEWHALADGTQPYPVHAQAAKQLPKSQFVLTKQGAKLRLEWRPSDRRNGGPVVREAVGR